MNVYEWGFNKRHYSVWSKLLDLFPACLCVCFQSFSWFQFCRWFHFKFFLYPPFYGMVSTFSFLPFFFLFFASIFFSSFLFDAPLTIHYPFYTLWVYTLYTLLMFISHSSHHSTLNSAFLDPLRGTFSPLFISFLVCFFLFLFSSSCTMRFRSNDDCIFFSQFHVNFFTK